MTLRGRREEQAAGYFHQSVAPQPEWSNDLTLDIDVDVGINGIPRRRLERQVVSPAQFETGGKIQTAGLEEIMR